MRKIFATAILGLVAAIMPMAVMPVAANPINETEGPEKTVKKIRKELVTLPFYGVFDNLAFKYEDGKVILYGQVSRPTLKSDAKRVVERVAGVEEV
ncbi:MAG: BON domain-containing protein, partial [Blastocatellia bacterium]